MLAYCDLPPQWGDRVALDKQDPALSTLTQEVFLTDPELVPVSGHSLVRVLSGLGLKESRSAEVVDRVVSLIEPDSIHQNPFGYVDSYLVEALGRIGYVSLADLTPPGFESLELEQLPVLAAFGFTLDQNQLRDLSRLVAEDLQFYSSRKRVAFYVDRCRFLKSGYAERLKTPGSGIDPVPDFVSKSMLEASLRLLRDHDYEAKAAALVDAALVPLDDSVAEFAADVIFESGKAPLGLVKTFARKMAEVPDPYLVLDVLEKYDLYYGMLPAEVEAFEGLTEETLQELAQLPRGPRPMWFHQVLETLND